MCFLSCQKTHFLEIGAVHQFAYGVDQIFFFGVWICHNVLMVPKSFIFIGSQIGSHGVFGSDLMRHNSGE
jgi:hypothetical protein